MPNYQYKCPDGHVVDAIYPIRENKPMHVPCTTCGKEARRKWDATPFRI